MKFKKIIMLALLLVIVIIWAGAVSAAQDNVTDDNIVVAIENNSFNDLQILINDSVSDEINLTNDYTYHEGDKPILINKSIIINGNNHTLNALNKSSILNIKAGNVVIKNLNFLNAGCGEFNLTTYGISYNAVIVDDFNRFNAYDNYGMTFPKTHIGGAIYSTANSLVIEDCKFKNNHASLGGAINSNDEKLFINNTEFINNTAYIGAAIYLNTNNTTIHNSKFTNNNASSFGAGIYQKRNKVKLVNSTFSNNHAINNSTLFLLDYWELSETNLTYFNTFINFNKIYIPRFGVENIYNNTFELMIKFSQHDTQLINKSFCLKINNIIYNLTVDGNISCILKFNSILKNSTILLFNPITNSNYTTSIDLCNDSFYSLQKLIDSNSEINLTKDYQFHDGDIWININKPIIINGNGHIIDARNKSRIFNITSDNVIIKNIIFINANANKNMEAHVDKNVIIFPPLEFMDESIIIGIQLEFNSVAFKSNKFYDTRSFGSSPYEGGAIYCSGNNLKIINSTFINNYASCGGAISISGNNSKLINLTFTNNSAKRGGAIFNSGKDTLISQSLFNLNNATKDESSIVSSNNINIQNCNLSTSKIIFDAGNWQLDNMTSDYFNSYVKFDSISDIEYSLSHLHDDYYNLKITFGIRPYFWVHDCPLYEDSYGYSQNKIFYLNIDGKVYNLKTNGKSQANLDLKLSSDKIHSIKVYNPITNMNISKVLNISGIKITPKIIAKNKHFNKKTKTKYSVILKDNANKPIKNTWITLKVKGKLFKAKTNSKGKATFKIKLKKKNKYVATVTFNGNANYNKITKKVKFIIK